MSVRMLSLVIVIGMISAMIVGFVFCVNVAWWSRVDIDRSDVRGRLGVECVSGVVGGWMLRWDCVWLDSWLMMSSSCVVMMLLYGLGLLMLCVV